MDGELTTFQRFPPASRLRELGVDNDGKMFTHAGFHSKWKGHAVLLVGYDRKEGYFKFQNSWGTSWGDSGYFYTSFEFLVDPRLARDFWMFND